jgi:anti-sigma factor RsiW
MTIMDHNEAVRLQAAEKYVLGKLPKEQHAAYEEHYFDCPACAEEIKATVTFMESARQVVREENPQVIDEKRLVSAARTTGGWFAWLRPAFAVPIFAALLLFIGYQNSVTIPGLQQSLARIPVAEVVRSFSLMSSASRGEGPSPQPIRVGAYEDWQLDVDPPGNSASGYVFQIQNESGKDLATFNVSTEVAKNTVPVKIRGGSLQPGKYTFVIFKGQTQPGEADHQSAAAQKSFVVEFVP